ncbi:hypothetical protein XYCOK13_29900 [Xylanibacillus composti]|uniref:Ribosomal processing cysteine protease Prp n=1 Tax=Xylanibacillus composti TaxID=1572762 RepID=A0A8J4H5N9_9BACL|nr:ribosomal-processing cysteine protease Prp [Xylanibacillus composti]GIQ70166.1 hypothetical protein XYCOK13_29900 [Xylanibacillus composti]
MINVRIFRQADAVITGFRVSGHAYYDDPGKDIVCAGVSAVAVGAVNAVEALTGVVPATEMEPGFLEMQLPAACRNSAAAEKVQTILETMEQMLLTIADSYGDFVRISREGLE